MAIPVTGFIVDEPDDEADSSHSHKLYITSWDGRAVHVHPFEGTTSFDIGHQHEYAGITEPAQSGVQHAHGYYAVTSFDDGHTHIISGMTGPAIPLADGGHIHYFAGHTTENGRIPHTHVYQGNTGIEE
ncbi:hypothetical protein SD71_14205 [Cohnella kolymensis]|uniref:YmaF family protein n=1 Tax=Cohnella kolymensis TaxID=1590652 RepID=A0ABR5A413_9BACL|nr:YmaF family protein [Cohnella kolymensis]KIL35438.1 hypothetical protein SD71_14205 [Cohnella kolymensis]